MKGELLAEAKRLSVAERAELAEAIWETIAENAGSDELGVPEEHRRELDRRLAEGEATSDVGQSWTTVRARIERER